MNKNKWLVGFWLVPILLLLAVACGSPPPTAADFSFEPRFVEVLGSKMHYVDEGEGDPILLIHGNPTSSYLWRNIIPHLTDDARVIAVDLIGMGRSDKPDIEYRFFDHVRYLEGFINELQLENITLVIHDWGSALGFYYAMRHQSNVKGVVFMEAILGPIPSWEVVPQPERDKFQAFRTPDIGRDLIINQNVFIEQFLPGGIVRKLSEEEMNHYREPFQQPSSREPVWRWPNELPIAGEPADVVEAAQAYNQWLQQTELPKLLFHATPGLIITPPVVEWSKQNLKNLQTVDLGPGIHFLQEDHPDAIGLAIAHWYRSL